MPPSPTGARHAARSAAAASSVAVRRRQLLQPLPWSPPPAAGAVQSGPRRCSKWLSRAAAAIAAIVAVTAAAGAVSGAHAQAVGAADEMDQLRPLDERYPDFIFCNPADTYGCISRCHRGVFNQENQLVKMCAMLNCVSECTKVISGECAEIGARACRNIKAAMDANYQICEVSCLEPNSVPEDP
eukprot:TRINITY_DN45616_c0_g1_i1.p1 TRINITY_DN45616_c0_g1~~TRINITY_DN45616_c0_g1_i1.p1  ORF type:complete len:185 (+),score=44.72 TRINITY_DN45616_c0_g1_i1:97-651(+)